MRRQKQASEARGISRRNTTELIADRVNSRRSWPHKYPVISALLVRWVCLLSFLMFPIISRAGDVKGRVTIAGGTSNANAVIYIETVDSVFDPPAKPAVMDQNHLAFKPEVLPILAGTAVQFLNSDEVLHDVFTPSPCAGSFNLGSFPPGESKTYTFSKAGCDALILCDIHPEMQAWVVVLQNPYFAVSGKDGNYVIKGIPAGTYSLRTWFGYYNSQSVRITVPRAGSVSADFQLKQ